MLPIAHTYIYTGSCVERLRFTGICEQLPKAPMYGQLWKMFPMAYIYLQLWEMLPMPQIYLQLPLTYFSDTLRTSTIITGICKQKLERAFIFYSEI
jgi:hypothetical protein